MVLRWRAGLLVGILAVTSASSALAGKQTCPQYLSAAPEKADLQSQTIQTLISELDAKLAPFADPFFWSTTAEEMIQIWNDLKTAYPDLGSIREAVFESSRSGQPVSAELQRKIIQDALVALQSTGQSRLELSAILIALDKVREYQLSRQLAVQESPSTDDKRSPQKKNDQPEAKKNTKKDEQGPAPQPKFPDAQKDYKASNKDTEQAPGPKQERVTMAWVNRPTVRYFKFANYQLVDAANNQWRSAPVKSADLSRYNDVSKTILTIHLHSEQNTPVRVFVPQGHVPLTFQDANTRVWKDESQNYFLQSSLKEVQIPLVPMGQASRPLSPVERDTYTSSAGSKLSDWPEFLQEQIRTAQSLRSQHQSAGSGRYFGPDGDVKLGRDLAALIALRFKYRVDADPESWSAFELAKRGAFQCDTAATILTSILRDEFNIASRPVGGFQGVQHRDFPNTSHVIFPSTGHAWVEIADAHGNWWPVDPTPIQKDIERNKDQENQKQDSFRDMPPETPQKEEPKDHQSEPNSNSSSESGSSSLKDIVEKFEKEQIDKREKREAAEQKTSNEFQKSESNPEQNAKEKPATEEIQSAPIEDYLSKLENEKKPEILFLIKRMIAWAVSPHLSHAEISDRLSQLKAAFHDDQLLRREINPILSQATQLYSGTAGNLSTRLTQLQTSQISVANTVHSIVQIQRELDFYVRLLESDERSQWLPMVRALDNARRSFASIKHPNSRAIRIAQELFENLPGNISKQVLKERFGLQGSLGDDVATLEFAQAIVDQKLNDFRLTSLLGPHTEFLTDPIHHLTWKNIKTWQRAIRRQRGRPDLLPTRDWRDRRKFVRLFPNLTDAEAVKRMEMYVLAQRQRNKIPDGLEDKDPEKATILCYDTSGSMSGDIAYFQSTYIGALVDRALSDIGPTGRVRHKVYLLGFDSTVHTVHEVTSVQQALDLIRNMKNSTGNTGGGTDIQVALLEAAKVIEKANLTGEKALAQATIVLTSDGQSPVQRDVVREAIQKAIGKDKTDVLMAFVAINSSNPDLISLAEDSATLGAQAGMYVEWTSDDISRMLAASRATPEPINDFWSAAQWSDIPTSIKNTFYDALRIASTTARRQESDLTWSPSKFNSLIHELKFQNQGIKNYPAGVERPGHYSASFRRIRRLLILVGTILDEPARKVLTLRLLERWKQFFPVSVSDYDYAEAANVEAILNWHLNGSPSDTPSPTP